MSNEVLETPQKLEDADVEIITDEMTYTEIVEVLDSTASCNPVAFLEELQLLCQKHNMTIFAGAMGLRFIPRDSQGINIAGTDDIAGVYFTQSFADKAFYPVQY